MALPIVFLLGCIASPSVAQAVNPPSDGGYPGGNTAEGQSALLSLTTGAYNTAVGLYSLLSLTDDSFNTGVGAGTLLANTADSNTAIGAGALLSNTIGSGNAAAGAFTLFNNITGSANTAIGESALFSNTTGNDNTAIGTGTLFSSSSGASNTAIGSGALFFNIASFNTAVGFNALHQNTGFGNTSEGSSALTNNTTGDDNTAVGRLALFDNIAGANNTAIGSSALGNNTTGNGNIALGFSAGSGITTADNVICIGASGADLSNTCFIDNIYTTVQPQIGIDPDFVTVRSDGRLGRGNVSSRRYKHDIKPMDKASEAIYALKPVSFRYHKQYDATQTVAFGLIAEEVAEVAHDLVGRNEKGEPESVRYEQINAMLLNEFLKAHNEMQELKATAAQQQKQIESLVTSLQRVTAQLDLEKPALEVALKTP